ncbi:hypothetical protein GGI04_001822 [Coemansia thaxteri]|uniref:Uncharacterized protein n=1 Tax=Coemansia thaxteri TaxID=2663907 RepID=A0A9W8BD52_9FUNG|nr:hypothetical protein H4R26_003183 [Coemansia thaxteri]KAJ2006613.1 hypothetical protein GGI04_001822 [Coemansia thaxteri]KAJ2472059.1 hypothetical protein GGI02_001848 [Coemansia sp. RSA 2322]KAJ2484467.1 hypothetical protein EV174_002412 [Coemansia sp. RSA 2320]
MDAGEPQLLEVANIDQRIFSDEPLLMRVERATIALHKELEDSDEKRSLEIISLAANAGLVRPVAAKKEMKNYGKPGHEQVTSDVLLKYRLREEQLLQSGTLDIPWGVKWLLSYVVLLDTPVLGAESMAKMINVVRRWLTALADADIHEVKGQLADLNEIVDRAYDELLASRALASQMPGLFNAACSLLYAGQLRSLYVDEGLPNWVLRDRSSAAAGAGNNQHLPATDLPEDHMSVEEARQYVAGTVADDARCSHSRAVDLIVESIGSSAADESSEWQLRVVVRVFDRQRMMAAEEDAVSLRFEYALAENLRPGQVIEATLHTLSDGCSYIDAVTMVWPSYSPLDYVGLC